MSFPRLFSQKRLQIFMSSYATLLWSVQKEKTSFQHYNSKTNLYPRENIHMFPYTPYVCCKYFSIVARTEFVSQFSLCFFRCWRKHILEIWERKLYGVVKKIWHNTDHHWMALKENFHLSIGFFTKNKISMSSRDLALQQLSTIRLKNTFMKLHDAQMENQSISAYLFFA